MVNTDKMLKACPDGILILDLLGNIKSANEVAVTLYGYESETLLEMNYGDLMASALYRTLDAHLERLIQTEHPREERHKRCDGSEVRVMALCRPIPIAGHEQLLCNIRKITEQATTIKNLRQSHAQFRMIIDMLPSLIAYVDAQGYLQLANKSHAALFARPMDKILQHSLRQVVGETIWPKIASQVARALAGEPASFEQKRTFPDGTTRWLSISYTPDFDADDRVCGFMAMANDITQAKKKEAALRESEALYRTIARSLPDGYVFVVDRNLRFLVVEGPLMKKLNIDRAALEGNSVTMMKEDRLRALVSERCRKALAGETQSYETEINGFILWTQYTPLYDDITGEVVAAMALCLNINDRRQAQEALKQSEQTYRTYINACPIAMFIIDAEGQYLDVNEAACQLLGYGRSELLGMTIAQVALPGGGDGGKLVTELKLTGRLRAEGRLWHKDGREIPVTIEAVRIGHERFMAFYADMTEHLALQAQLNQAQKMEAIGQLAGGVAHDFNNLLQVINGHTELLLESVPSQTMVADSVKEIALAGRRAARLVSQLLAFSRRQIMSPGDLDLNEVIADLLKMLHRVIGEHIRLDFIPGHDLGNITADRHMLEQCLVNLCVNARDAMPGGGDLIIETENILINGEYCKTHNWAKLGRFVLLSVTDNGMGMERDIVEKIFEPFFTTKETGKGTGLGLATVYGIVRQHEGMITVYSEPQKGTTFKLYLPLSHRKAVSVGSKLAGPLKGGSESILLAEDDELVSKVAKTILERAGYTVLTAGDGIEAVRLMQANADKVDLLLLDVVMPHMGGKEAYDQIHALHPGIPVLFASGYSESAVHANFVLKEGLDLIQKPFARNELLRAVRRILDQPSGQQA